MSISKRAFHAGHPAYLFTFFNVRVLREREKKNRNKKKVYLVSQLVCCSNMFGNTETRKLILSKLSLQDKVNISKGSSREVISNSFLNYELGEER